MARHLSTRLSIELEDHPALFGARELSTMAYALATLRDCPLLGLVARVAVPLLRDFSPRDIATICQAFGTAGLPAPELFEAVSYAVTATLAREFNPQDVTLRTRRTQEYASALLACVPLCSPLSPPSPYPGFDGSPPSQVANTVWAFATLRFHAPGMFAALAEAGVKLVRAMTQQELANIWCVHM